MLFPLNFPQCFIINSFDKLKKNPRFVFISSRETLKDNFAQIVSWNLISNVYLKKKQKKTESIAFKNKLSFKQIK